MSLDKKAESEIKIQGKFDSENNPKAPEPLSSESVQIQVEFKDIPNQSTLQEVSAGCAEKKEEHVEKAKDLSIKEQPSEKQAAQLETELSSKEGVPNDIYLHELTRDKLVKLFKATNKDLDYKIFGKLLLNKKGYYCELECKLFDSSYYYKYKKEEISDIDVYGIRFDEDLQCTKFGLECKSTTGNGVDEALKLKGIQIYNELDIVGLVKKKISNNVRLVSNKLGIQVFDELEIKKIVSILIPDYKKLFEVEHNLYILKNSIETQLKDRMKGVISFIKASYWTKEPYQNIHTIVKAFERMRVQNNLLDYQRKYLSIRLSILLALSLLEISSKIVKANLSNIEQVALDLLFGGANERWEKQRTYDLLSQEIGKKINPFPYYTVDYLNIISWFISEMGEASKVSLCLEQYLNFYLLGEDYQQLRTSFSDITIKLSKDILRFTAKILNDNVLFTEIYKV